MRTAQEIKKIFEAKKCLVEVSDFGTSYRTGGAVIIYAPGINPDAENFSIIESGKTFNGTGYDNRGRTREIYIFNIPKKNNSWEKASIGQFQSSKEENCFSIGYESRSGENARFFIRSGSDNLSDLSDIFSSLGL